MDKKSDSNNKASNNAIQTPKWCYVAMENTGNGVTTEVVMQCVAGDDVGYELMKPRDNSADDVHGDDATKEGAGDNKRQN